ncbi:hypothetical protein [Mucilaginibacter pedocola]|uniref:Uncharacterized protein n=1 Tax=Mucilaginibacter pedocola TaxID=1792845 RepID=A0A1S9PKI3_9SPHI|nr:hypothetical protein [Mucilaginibacter pedocola]OOQ61429.1 hypothetical protein BC343_20910 [Mucilaginibacter pedocola]
MNTNTPQLNNAGHFYMADVDTLLHGPYNSARMAEELKKIDAHVVEDDALMKNAITSIAVTLVLAVVAYMFYFPVMF